jgi:hypothetical protein
MKVMLIWDLKSYQKRLSTMHEKRKAAAEDRKKPQRTMSEYQADQAAAKRGGATDNEGFKSVKPRRRPRKPTDQ